MTVATLRYFWWLIKIKSEQEEEVRGDGWDNVTQRIKAELIYILMCFIKSTNYSKLFFEYPFTLLVPHGTNMSK